MLSSSAWASSTVRTGVLEALTETGKNRGLVLIVSSSVSMEGCQRKSIWTEHSTPRSASPLSQPPVFPGLLFRQLAQTWGCKPKPPKIPSDDYFGSEQSA